MRRAKGPRVTAAMCEDPVCSGCWETAPTHFFPPLRLFTLPVKNAGMRRGSTNARRDSGVDRGLDARLEKLGPPQAKPCRTGTVRARCLSLVSLLTTVHGRPALWCCMVDYRVQPSDIHPRCLCQTKQAPALQFYLGTYLTESQPCCAGANDASPITLSVCPVQKRTLRAAAPRLSSTQPSPMHSVPAAASRSQHVAQDRP